LPEEDAYRCPSGEQLPYRFTSEEEGNANPQAMRPRRETVEHPFGTMKVSMGATHFLTKKLPKVAAEMALSGESMSQIDRCCDRGLDVQISVAMFRLVTHQ
jgi:hypothetical protein